MIDAAFNQIRQNSGRSLATMLRLLKAFERIGEYVHDEESRVCLRQQMDVVYHQAMEAFTDEYDRRSIVQAYQTAIEAIDQVPDRRGR
jgi:uncharacterized membrane protein